MNIPPFINSKFVEKDGTLSSYGKYMMQQLITQLQTNAGTEGIVTPAQPATNIALLNSSQNGTLIYDSTNDLLKANIAGTFQTIVTM